MSLFELSVTLQYIIPRKRQLSSSFIGQLSVLVISLVVWLILVFFSVSYGLEEVWTQKFTNITPPIRLVPTKEYYNSYYYIIDRYSEASLYSLKSLEEKRTSSVSDPYDPSIDGQLPDTAPKPLVRKGVLVDLVKEAFNAVDELADASAYAQLTSFAFFSADSDALDLPAHYTLFSSIDPQNPHLDVSLQEDQDESLIKKGKSGWELLQDENGAFGVLLPKSYRESGLKIGSRLYFHDNKNNAPKGYVAGFYDPGILPMGNRVVIASVDLLSQLGSASMKEQTELDDSIGVRIQNLRQVDKAAEQLQKSLEKRGVAPYFRVETYKSLPYVQQILQQLQSEKLLFSLISLIILAVASSNIISMLLILVRDKRTEIGIYRALGLSSIRVAAIFLLAGAFLGLIAACIGLVFALFTLHYLDILIDGISYLQGFELFNHNIFGRELPNKLHMPVVYATFIAVLSLSSLCALLPAAQALLYNPSDILKEK